MKTLLFCLIISGGYCSQYQKYNLINENGTTTSDLPITKSLNIGLVPLYYNSTIQISFYRESLHYLTCSIECHRSEFCNAFVHDEGNCILHNILCVPPDSYGPKTIFIQQDLVKCKGNLTMHCNVHNLLYIYHCTF